MTQDELINKIINAALENAKRRVMFEIHRSPGSWTSGAQIAILPFVKHMAWTGEAHPRSIGSYRINELTNENRKVLRECLAAAYIDLQAEKEGFELMLLQNEWFSATLSAEAHFRETQAAAKAARTSNSRSRKEQTS